MAKRKAKAKIEINVGDHVLLGGTRASYPGGWYRGTVLWVGTNDVLVERSTQNGQSWREVEPISHIRAIGTYTDLLHIQNTARAAVRDLQVQIYDCEQALGKARDALFAKLDEFAEAEPKLIAPDFEKIEADHAAERAAVDASDAEAV